MPALTHTHTVHILGICQSPGWSCLPPHFIMSQQMICTWWSCHPMSSCVIFTPQCIFQVIWTIDLIAPRQAHAEQRRYRPTHQTVNGDLNLGPSAPCCTCRPGPFTCVMWPPLPWWRLLWLHATDCPTAYANSCWISSKDHSMGMQPLPPPGWTGSP